MRNHYNFGLQRRVTNNCLYLLLFMLMMESKWIYFVVAICMAFCSQASSDSEFVDKFREEAVERHNMYRQGYEGDQPLVISDELCKTSQERAYEWSRNSHLSENTFTDYGESTFAIPLKKNTQIFGSTPVDTWYDQIHDYNFQTGRNAPNTKSEIESFAQVVWKGSKEMCISFAIGTNSKLETNNIPTLYIVAHYNPEGNINGTHVQNVKPIFNSPNFYLNSQYAPSPKHLTPPLTQNSTTVDLTRDKKQHVALARCGKFPKEPNVTTPLEWIEEAIHHTNSIRVYHGAPELIHNPILDQVAQKIVNTFVMMQFNKAPMSKLRGCGETIFTKIGSDIDPSEPIEAWYKEVKSYDFRHHRSLVKTHSVAAFAQLVWKKTREMGIAFAVKDGKIYVVGIFAPPGNHIDEYKDNISNGGNGNKVGVLLLIAALVGIAYEYSKMF